MLAYIARRLLLMIPTLLGILAVVFFIMAYAPGGTTLGGLSAEGEQTEGQDAKRARKRMERRYGLDQPRPVQFGRWLNQISPVGFRMSSDIEFEPAQRQAAADRLDELAFNTHPNYLERAVNLTLNMAAYHGQTPQEMADRLAAALAEPREALDLFAWMGVDLEPTTLEAIAEELAHLRQTRGLGRAQNELINQLAFEASGVARVRFDKPALKVPDFGQSNKGRNVLDMILEHLPITILLNALSLPLIYLVAIMTGVYAARHRGSWFDIGSSVVFLTLWSIPVIWAGAMLIRFTANEQYLHWFPTAGLHDLQADQMLFLPRIVDGAFERGWLLDTMWHLVLPVLCLTYTGFAVMSKVMRGAMLDSLSSHFVRTARAKGVGEREVLWVHTFRNSILPLITMAASLLPAMFVGSVVVEDLFSINGMGRLAITAAKENDREVVMATTLFAGLLGLTAELIRDICYAIADPRVSYE